MNTFICGLSALLTKYYSGYQTKNGIGGACSTYKRQERCKQGFSGETWGTETTWETYA